MIRTSCPYCGVGCGVRVTCGKNTAPLIQGDSAHPANRGRLCVKGAALGETLGLDNRLLTPRVDGREVGWEAALNTAATRLKAIIAESGPESVAFYASGQLLTEDYYVANKLMKGYLGVANIDTNSRLCMSSAVSGYQRAFGEDVVPVSYADLEAATLVVLVGSNLAWCHPVLFARLLRARQANPEQRLVVIDPRRTASCEQADLHLPLEPGSDVWLFNGLLHHLQGCGAVDTQFVDAHTRGCEAALAAANDATPARVARECRLNEANLNAFYQLFGAHERVVTLFSQGVNQSTAGTDKVNSIINCHLYSGRIGKQGAGPFSITGQPNAMGGREVGGLASQLAAHMSLDNPQHRERVQRFWGSPSMASKPGLKAVDIFQEAAAGRVRAIWIMATNPVVSLPDADLVKAALKRCELVLVSDCEDGTDSVTCADIVFPAASWGEKSGCVTNSERVILRSRAFLPLPGEARPDWWIISQMASRLGFNDAFDYTAPWQIFVEHARLSAFENNDERYFNLEALANLDAAGYAALEPVRWPVRHRHAAEPFSDGRFSHADGRARFVATAARPPIGRVDGAYPLVLNTGRVRDHWHTMTRTGRAPSLGNHSAEPFVDMHPHDVQRLGLQEGCLARIASHSGSMVARVVCAGGMREGQVFVPIHWNDSRASDARVGALIDAAVDAISGQPEFKHTPVSITPFAVSWYGVALSRTPLATEQFSYWAKVRGKRFWRYELAGRGWPETISDWAKNWLNATSGDWLEYHDQGAGTYRGAHLGEGVEACVFISRRSVDLPERSWLAALMQQPDIDDNQRISLLAGHSLGEQEDAGAVICACFGVGRNTICAAVRDQNMTDVGQITACLKAGGNCGSCVPELKQLLTETHASMAGGFT